MPTQASFRQAAFLVFLYSVLVENAFFSTWDQRRQHYSQQDLYIMERRKNAVKCVV